MKSKIIFLSLFTFCLIFVACNKDEETIDVQYPLAPEQTVDQNIETLSKLLASAMYGNTEFKSVIKEEIGYRFDHDYDALLLTFLGKTIAGKAFEELLAESSNGKYKPADVVRMIKKSGYLHMSIPVHFEAFDPAKDELMVFPIASMVEENVAEELEAFDHLGNRVRFSAKEAPKVPVLVVMLSERVDKDGLLMVNESGVVLPKENRTHYLDAILYAKSNLKSVSTQKNRLIQVYHDENELDSLIQIFNLDNYINSDGHINFEDQQFSDINHLKSAGEIKLTGRVSNPNKMDMEWYYEPSATSYNIYMNGSIENSSGYKEHKSDYLIHNTAATTKEVAVDYSNEAYTFYVIPVNGSQELQEKRTNKLKLHSSGRKNNGEEYLDKIFMSASLIRSVEGWWASDIEICSKIQYVNYSDIVSEIEGQKIDNGLNVKKNKWGTTVDNTWDGHWKLFNWDRNTLEAGSYTITFWEFDFEEGRKDEYNVVLEVVKYAAKVTGYETIYEEYIAPIPAIVEGIRNNDYLGSTVVKWWDPLKSKHDVTAGFDAYFNHNPDNN